MIRTWILMTMERINRIYSILFVLAAFLLNACSDDSLNDATESQLVPLTISATTISSTRTALDEDGTTVLWQEGDQIAVYDYKTTKHNFSSSIGTDGHTKFSGKITAKSQYFAAIYPYTLASENATSNSELTATLPSTQYAVEGNFPECSVNESTTVCNISVTKGERNLDGSPAVVTFHNVGQLLRFSIPSYATDQISSIQFTAPTAVAGKLNINYSSDSPDVSIASTESKVITLLPPRRSSTFSTGTYYIVTAPVSLSGFSMSFTAGSNTYSLSSNSTFGGTAGRIYNLGSVDLVNTPSVTAAHVYEDGVLQGTKINVTNAPIEGKAWAVTIKNSSNNTVRTLSGTDNLSSPETDASWPYLPTGTYTVSYTYTTSNGKSITKSLPNLSITEKPKFSVDFSAYTSYSYVTGDGVTQSITEANKLSNNKIYAPTLTLTGISSRILGNSNYKFTLTPSGFSSSLKSSANGNYVYNDVTVTDWKAYDLSVSVAFDGVTKSAGKTVYITGLPYTATPPKNSGDHAWSVVQGGGKIDWNSGNVALGEGGTTTADPTIKSPEFYLPNGSMNVLVKAEGTLHTRQVLIYYRETLTMYVGSTSIWSQESPQKSTTPASFAQEVNTAFSSGSNYLRFSVGARTELSGYARITSVNIRYR